MKRAALFLAVLLTIVSALSMFIGCSDDPVDPGGSVGRIGVYPKPAGVDFIWRLTGPDGYAHSDTGDVVLDKMKAGDYTISWQEKLSWITPTDSVVTKTLKGGEFLSFSTTYLDIGGAAGDKVIKIVVSPSDMLAPWTLKGPSDYEETGEGSKVFFNMTYGVYTITWGEVDGFDISGPQTETQEMTEGTGLTFSALYESSIASEIRMAEIYTDKVLRMGANDYVARELGNEGPRHLVYLTRDFLMSESEITWVQYERVMAGENPSTGGCPTGAVCSSLPVQTITWLQTLEFCNAASALYGFDHCYDIVGDVVTWDQDANGFRLPTEAEWEFAAADSLYSLHTFDYDPSSCYQDDYLDEIGWYCNNASWPPDSDAGSPQPHAAKSLMPSSNGLYDMHGNVWEWVWDYNKPYDAFSINVVELWSSTNDSIATGSATVVDGRGAENASALSLSMSSIRMNVSALGISTFRVGFDIVYYEEFTNLKVNGNTLYRGDLALAPEDIAPGVVFEITGLEGDVGVGKLCHVTLSGDITTLTIGGEYIVIDDILIEDSDPSEYALDRLIDFETSTRGLNFPFGPFTSVKFGCTVTDPIGPSTGSVHMLRGGCYLNSPKYCRATTRSAITDKAYTLAGFRVVRNMN